MNFSYLNFSGCFFVLFRRGHFHNVVSTFTNIVKLDVENNNVVSTLSNVVYVNVEIHNVDSTLYISMLKYATLFQRWFDLLPRGDEPKDAINQKATLKQRWNVCWDVAKPDRLTLSKMRTSNLSLSKSANVTTNSGQSTLVISF